MLILSKLLASRIKYCALFVFVILAASSNKAAGAIVLSNATATFSQVIGTAFPVSRTIDGVFSGANGWAIDNQELNQTAVYEIAINPAGPSGAVFTFVMTQNLGSNHTLGRFRFSVTGDNPSDFADGLQTGGDVTANWTPVNPLTAVATGGAILTPQLDKSILASGPNPATSVYTITAVSFLNNITGLRLEVLEDASLTDGGPGEDGPGRQPINGNFVLSELQASAVAVVPEPSMILVFGIVAVIALPLRKVVSAALRQV